MTDTRSGEAGVGAAWQALAGEWARALRRAAGALELLARADDPPVGLTPRTEVYRRNKARLYRYAGPRTRRVPVLFVPNLGISRPYVFDLRLGASFIEYMAGQGFDFFLLDWGVYGEEDDGLTVEACVTGLLPRVARRVLATAGSDRLAVIGYCMGAPLSAAWLALEPEVPVAAYANMAGPIDFSKAGLFAKWLDKRFYDVDRVVDTVGAIPADWIRVGFKLLKPTMDVSTALNLWWNLDDPRYVEGYRALQKWANEYVPIPAEFFRQWVKAFYQENRLIRKELTLGGRLVDLGRIRCPVLVVAGAEDYIAPAPCVRALLDHVGSADRSYVELPGGHISLIAGRAASTHCWPTLVEWLGRRTG